MKPNRANNKEVDKVWREYGKPYKSTAKPVNMVVDLTVIAERLQFRLNAIAELSAANYGPQGVKDAMKIINQIAKGEKHETRIKKGCTV
jgi:hypothetical protein